MPLCKIRWLARHFELTTTARLNMGLGRATSNAKQQRNLKPCDPPDDGNALSFRKHFLLKLYSWPNIGLGLSIWFLPLQNSRFGFATAPFAIVLALKLQNSF